MSKLIGITIGDINGIGIKILIDTWKENKIKDFILFTDYIVLKKILRKSNYKLKLNLIHKINKKDSQNMKLIKGKINVYSYRSTSLEDNTIKSLKFGYEFCKKKICIGLLTLPIRKDLIIDNIDKNFTGHTEYFQKIDNKKHSNMILYNKKIFISPLTTHIKLKNVTKTIAKKDFIFKQIYNLNKCLKYDFNIKYPKIIISGLNPHAGENGRIGKEEIKYILPSLEKLKENKINIDGPVSADSILIKSNLENYNCFVFIYHDQALIPFKLLSQFTGVNYTGNLSIIRTSPDHGTAYNLLNSNNISKKSFLNCYKLINKIYKNRKMNDKS